ncbi:hypothetical protein J4410_06030 [Candidatus Woesearchaeota archaeon]|nr:hypothetical protein [Candidatus Woesearchaeota archaeon]
MKIKTILTMLTIFLALIPVSMAVVTIDAGCQPYTQVGDADNNNVFNVADAGLINLRILDDMNPRMRVINKACMDLDNDGRLTTTDTTVFLNAFVRGTEVLPPLGFTSYRMLYALTCDGSRPNQFAGTPTLLSKAIAQYVVEARGRVNEAGASIPLRLNSFFMVALRAGTNGYCQALDVNHDGRVSIIDAMIVAQRPR